MPGLPSEIAEDELLTDDGPGRKKAAPERRCIVSRETATQDDLIRFVVGPEGDVVPDIRCVLPGRGAWVLANRKVVEAAGTRKLFGRAFRRQVIVASDLGDMTKRLLTEDVLGALGLARRAGRLVTGFAKVSDGLRARQFACLLTAEDAADDGRRKLMALQAALMPELKTWSLFTAEQMSLAFGGGNVIHAALRDGHEAPGILKRLERLSSYRGETAGDHGLAEPDSAPTAPAITNQSAMGTPSPGAASDE